MAETKKSAGRRSDPGLDIYRGVAVVLMFLAHVWRVQSHTRVPPPGFISWLDGTLGWMDRAVAYVAASFLFIAGISLVLAHRDAAKRSSGRWLKAVLRRAGWLYLLSFVMFLPEHGFELPDILASSGILSVIAVAVSVTACALIAPHSNIALALLGAVILAVTYGLERTGTQISGLNAGPGGAIPLVMFSALGALTARAYLQRGVKSVFAIAGVALPAFVIALVHEDRWLAFYASVYQDHGGLALANWLGLTHAGTGTVTLRFWNPSALGALGLVAPVAATAGVFLAVQQRIAHRIVVRPLLMLGRHALFIFVAHYGLLGLVDLLDLRPPHAIWTLVLLVAITTMCVGMCEGLNFWRRRRAAR